MSAVRRKAEAILAAPDAVDAVETLLRNQLYLDETELRAEIDKLGFRVVTIGEGFGIEFPERQALFTLRVPYGETAADAAKKMAGLLRAKADELEALLK